MKIWTECLAVVLAVMVAYAPSLWNGFVYDDEVYVVANPALKEGLNLHKIFTESFPPGKTDQGLYRPITTLSLWLDAKIWRFASPGNWNGFHLTNTLLHALNGCLLLLILRRLGLPFWQRLVSGIVFALHPALSEAVAWVTGRSELLGASFGLLAVLAFLCETGKRRWVLFFISWILAMLCKETYIMLPGAVALLMWLFPEFRFSKEKGEQWSHTDKILAKPRRSSSPPSFAANYGATPAPLHGQESVPPCEGGWKQFLIWGGVCAGVVVGFMFLRQSLMGSWRPSFVAYQDFSFWTRIFTSLEVLWRYLGIWLWPFHLSVHHEIRPVLSRFEGFFLIFAWIFLIWLVWRGRKFSPWYILALGWFWVFIFIVSNLAIPIGAVSGERFMYISTLMFAPGLIVFGNKLFALTFKQPVNSERMAPWVVPLKAVLIVFWCGILFFGLEKRLNDWESNQTLWESVLRRYPKSFVAKGMLADALLQKSDFSHAHRLAAEALEQLRSQQDAYRNLFEKKFIMIAAASQSGMRLSIWKKRFDAANKAAKTLKPQEALDEYRSLIRDFPDQPMTYDAIGDLYVRLKNPVAALQNYQEALDLGFKNHMIYGKYGQVLSELGKKAEAVLAYEDGLKLNPRDPIILYNRGCVLIELGDFSEALNSFREANKVMPGLAAPHLNAASVLIHLKRYDEAEKELQPVLALDPKQTEALALLQKIARERNGGK